MSSDDSSNRTNACDRNRSSSGEGEYASENKQVLETHVESK
jgi:hypothetical protein